jgi:hypothetical protein
MEWQPLVRDFSATNKLLLKLKFDIWDLWNYLIGLIHGHSSRLPDMTRHLPASRPATIAGVFWGRQLG